MGLFILRAVASSKSLADLGWCCNDFYQAAQDMRQSYQYSTVLYSTYITVLHRQIMFHILSESYLQESIPDT